MDHHEPHLEHRSNEAVPRITGTQGNEEANMSKTVINIVSLSRGRGFDNLRESSSTWFIPSHIEVHLTIQLPE